MELNLLERRYARALTILDGKANGMGMPVLRHLALRRMPEAMVALSNYLAGAGRLPDSLSRAGPSRRAFRQGDASGAHSLAMDHFNRGDLQGYRHWLGRAARTGDPEAARELKRFETRLPHGAAKTIGRGRPYRRHDSG